MSISTSGYTRAFHQEFAFVSRLLDAGIVWLILFLLRSLGHIEQPELYRLPALLAIIFYFLAAELFSLYRSFRLETYGEIAKKIALCWGLVCLLLVLIALATKSSTVYSRLTIGWWFVLTPLALMMVRFLIHSTLRRIRSQSQNLRSYAILGDSPLGQNLPEKIQNLPWTGLQFVGHYELLSQLLSDLQTQSIDYVFLSYSSHEQDKIVTAINALNDSTASTYLVPDLLLSDLLGSRWIMLGNIPLVIINDQPFYGGAWALKKIEDLVLGSAILLLALPLMFVIALAIKLTSAGPILFKQRRHGLNGEVIRVFKFRTMTTQEDGSVVVQATADDARITPVGKFLRRTSLDELPQFFNVLEGSMSIVGPRPHAIAHNDHYRKLIDGYMQRHKVKPGITGWAQVNGLRGETDTLDKMQSRVDFDLYYINHWSLGLDLKILLLTFFAVFNGKKAY